MKGKSKRWRVYSVIAGTALGWLLCFLAIVYLKNPMFRARFESDYRTQMARFGEALLIAEANYYDKEKADFASLTEEALSGMYSSLDRHSEFYPPEKFKALKRNLEMVYGGCGFRSRRFRGEHFVSFVFPGSPAANAGLKRGDRIVAIDGESTSEWASPKFHRQARGPVDTEVTLEADGPSGKRTLTIKRAKIAMKSVDNHYVDRNGVGYVRILQFTEKTGDDVTKALKKMTKQPMEFLILDLRGNQGGLVSACVDTASCFLEPGQLVISAQSRNEEKQYRTKDRGVRVDVPMAILLNRYSASASESLAGSLHAHGRAILVGETSGGKGSGQNIRSLSHDSGMKLTTLKYFLPNGVCVDGIGLEPDVHVSHVEKISLQLFLQRDAGLEIHPDRFTKMFGVSPIADPVYEAALKRLQDRPSLLKTLQSASQP